MTPLDQYLNAARVAGCPADQIKNFVKAGIVLQPKQLAASAVARLADETNGPDEIGFGGARGGGKSHWIISQLGADDCQRRTNLKMLLLRKSAKANKENFEDLRRRALMQLDHHYNRQEGILTFKNGSRIICGHFKDEKDIDKYLGLEYDGIGVEEATTLSKRKYDDIRTCCRTSRDDWRPRMYNNTNPGGIGHAWYKQRFILPFQKQKQAGTCFVPSTLDDNRFLNAEYKKIMDGLSGWQRRAWRDGDWDIAAGQFFTMFRRDVHVVPNIDETRIKSWWIALDYGFTHYTVAYLGGKDSDGNLFAIDEHAERRWLPERHAAAIHAMLARHNLTFASLDSCVAGQDVFSKQSNGRTIAEDYAAHGIRLRVANVDRINGAGEILKRLGDPDNGIKPTVFICERCSRLADAIPSMIHDPNRPEDVLKVDCDDSGLGGDDEYDAFRYWIMSRLHRVVIAKVSTM